MSGLHVFVTARLSLLFMIHSRIAIPCCLSSWKHMGHSLPFPHHQINIQIITHTHTLLTAFLKINYKSAAKRKWQNLFRTSRNDWGINHHAKFFAQRSFSLKKKEKKMQIKSYPPQREKDLTHHCWFWRWKETVSQGTWAASCSWKRQGNWFSPRASRRNTGLPTPWFWYSETSV